MAALVGMVMCVAVLMQMIMLMGMGVIMAVSMGMLVGMGDTVVGVLVGMCVFVVMVMAMTAHVIVMNVHNIAPYPFSVNISYRRNEVKEFIARTGY